VPPALVPLVRPGPAVAGAGLVLGVGAVVGLAGVEWEGVAPPDFTAQAVVRTPSSRTPSRTIGRRERAGTQKWYTIFRVSPGDRFTPRSAEPGLASTEPTSAGPTRFESEAERAAAALRDQIIDGSRAPGDRLVERDLATELGVSRIPVRDALKTLVAEGLATPRPRTWAVVRTFTEADIDDLIEVRSALETMAFRLAAERGTADQLRELGDRLAAERQSAAAGDAATARRAAADFHETVIAMAHNGVLSELFDVTRSRMRWLLGQHSALGEMADEHAGLYQALADHDAPRAAALARDHLATSRRAALLHGRASSGPGIASGHRPVRE
jgi:DNA-binding GntR family transcriptional regulator